MGTGDRVDIAIAGGGPAGGWLARNLAHRGYSVALFERSPTAGEPNFSSAGSPATTTTEFQLPREAVAGTCSFLRATGPNEDMVWKFPRTAYHIYNFRTLKRMLLQEAERAGAQICFGTAVTGMAHMKPHPKILLAHGRTVEARIVVDASGPAGIIASAIGIRKRTICSPSTGLEIIAEVSPNTVPDSLFQTLAFYLGSGWAPRGYGWIFPMGQSRLKIGICAYQQTADPDLPPLRHILDTFTVRALRNKPFRTIETHGGSLFAQGGIKQHVRESVLAIGDAADQVNPLGGEGIRHVLHSARLAAACISEALDQNNPGALQRYNRLWRSYTGIRWKISAYIAQRAYTEFPDRTWDRVIRLCSRLSPEEMDTVLFKYRAGPALRAAIRSKLA